MGTTHPAPAGRRGDAGTAQHGAARRESAVSTSPSFSSQFLSSPHPKAALGLIGEANLSVVFV